MQHELTIKDFIFGSIDTLEPRSLPRGAASRQLNWITKVDRIVLRGGSRKLGNALTGTGKITGLFTAKMADGTEIPFRTRGKILEYYKISNDTWTEIGSNVLGSAAEGKDMSFAEYHSLAGDQLFINSPYGPLLKIMLANPGSYADMYDSAKNFKGYIKIKQNRMFLWGRLNDKTSPYLSFIDKHNYTAVSAEVIGTGNSVLITFAETLDFKAGGTKRTCFAISVTDGVETFTDNNDGTLTGSAGGTGTINYMTGAISVTFHAAPAAVNITCNYYWEDSTNEGICDFTYSSPREAREGVTFRQDDGGILQTIESFFDQEYCIHEKKTWVLTLTDDDTNAQDIIYRERVGIPNWRAAVSTSQGVFHVDDTDLKDPQIRILKLSVLGDKVVSASISKNVKYKNTYVGIDLSGYRFDQAVVWEWGDYILVACRQSSSSQNDRLILYNKIQNTIDIANYFISNMAVYDGKLISGDPLADNVYILFDGYDDDTASIENYREMNEDNLDWEGYKKVMKFRVKGQMGKEQKIKVWMSIDGGDYVELGEITIVSAATTSIGTIGSSTIGSFEIGGGSVGEEYVNFIDELDMTTMGKFNTVKVKFEATELGYCSISEYQFFDIRLKSRKIKKL